MGAGNSTNAAFYSISNGKICRAFKSPDKETIERVNKNGKTVYEKFYDYLDGRIISISTKENDYGKFWVVVLEDKDGRYQLEFQFSSGYSAGFLKALPNVDLSAPVKLIPKMTMEGDKKKTTVFINQHGKAIKWFYTKENKNGIPDLVQKKVKGKIVWDDSDIMEFLEEMVKTQIVPKLGNAAPAPVPAGELEPELEEDLPF